VSPFGNLEGEGRIALRGKPRVRTTLLGTLKGYKKEGSGKGASVSIGTLLGDHGVGLLYRGL